MVTQIMRKVYFGISIAASAFGRKSRACHPQVSGYFFPKMRCLFDTQVALREPARGLDRCAGFNPDGQRDLPGTIVLWT
jgi:hypothetical protein